MDSISVPEAARSLGTTPPRARRTISRLGLRIETTPGGHVRLSSENVECIRDAIGALPAGHSLGAVETKVLAVLTRAPLGLASVHAVARRAAVSPTSASKALRTLRAERLVTARREILARGRAREYTVYHPNWRNPRLMSLLPALNAVTFPVRRRAAPRATRLPFALRHLFWNADPRRIDPSRDGAYIAHRLLTTSDPDGLAWGIDALNADDWKAAASMRGLAPRTRALARNIARSRR